MKPDGAVNQTEDLPLNECAQLAEEFIAKGFMIFQKFTCEQCGSRLFMEEPNTFYKTGECDRCGHITEIKYCGFVASFKVRLEKQ